MTVYENDKTCPCGSGKAYIECCGSDGNSVLLDQIRWRRAGKELRRKLGEYADQPSLCWDAAKAQDRYLGCLDEKRMLHDDDFTMERCFEWFIFDFHTYKGLTIIERFLKDRSNFLDYYEKTMIEEWIKSRISLFEVLSTPGKGLLMQDLLFGKIVSVREINATTEIKAGCLVLIRVLKIGEEYEFSTSGLALPERYKAIILAKLAADRMRFYRKHISEDQGWDAYLKERSHKINAWVTELGTKTSIENEDITGLPNEQHVDAYPITDWQRVLSCFKNSGDFLVTRESWDRFGNLVDAVAICLGKGHGAGGLQAVRARMVLTANSLFIIADSLNTLKIAQKYYTENLTEKPCLSGETSEPADSAGECPADSYSWPAPDYANVAHRVKEGMEALGYSHVQQRGAVKLWFDYCSKERPAIRKETVWTATVIYAFTKLEKEEDLKQQDLAGHYGVSSSTISHRYNLLCRSLDLVAFDKRYTTKNPAFNGYRS